MPGRRCCCGCGCVRDPLNDRCVREDTLEPGDYEPCCDCAVDPADDQCKPRELIPGNRTDLECCECPCECCNWPGEYFPKNPDGTCPPCPPGCDDSVRCENSELCPDVLGDPPNQYCYCDPCPDVCPDEYRCFNGRCPQDRGDGLCECPCHITECWDGSDPDIFCGCPPPPCNDCLGGVQPHTVNLQFPGMIPCPDYDLVCQLPNTAAGCSCAGQVSGSDNRVCTEAPTRTLWLDGCYREIARLDIDAGCGPFHIDRHLEPEDEITGWLCGRGCTGYRYVHTPVNYNRPKVNAGGGCCGCICYCDTCICNCVWGEDNVPILNHVDGNYQNAYGARAEITRDFRGGRWQCRWSARVNNTHSGPGDGFQGVSAWFDADPATGLCDCTQPVVVNFPHIDCSVATGYCGGNLLGCCWPGGPVQLTPG